MPHTPTRRLHLPNETGQTLTEYSLLIALIAVAVAVLLPGLATALTGFFSSAAAAFGG
jgi:Flp pilus assembly pilin Flp